MSNPLDIASYTERSLSLLQRAETHGSNRGWERYGSECLLLAMLEEDCPAADALKERGVTYELARAEVENIRPFYKVNPQRRQSRPTPTALSILERAAIEAKSWKHPAVTPEHILLGIIALQDGTGQRLLDVMGIDIPLLKGGVIKRFKKALEAAPKLPRIVVDPSSMTLSEKITRSCTEVSDMKEELEELKSEIRGLKKEISSLVEIFNTWGYPPAEEDLYD